MTGNQDHEVKNRFPNYSSTRHASNHNWCFRGDNTKYKNKK
jgi:hypothetical protein